MAMDEEGTNQSETTLTQFIEQNQKLISTVGVLAALSVVTLKLPENQPAPLLASILFIMVLLLCAEIYLNFPFAKSGRLRWFQELFGVLVFGYGIVWLSVIYPYLLLGGVWFALGTVYLLVFAGLAAVIRKLMVASPWFKTRDVKKGYRIVPAVGAITLMLLGMIFLRHYTNFPKPH
jgi:hypothetical protein